MSKKLSDYLRYRTLEQIAEHYIDWTDAIVHDEFHKKESRVFPEKQDYRERAIERIVKANLNLGENGNINWNVAKRYMKIVCPYCEKEMQFHGSTGSMYTCECGAKANPNMGIYFEAPKGEK